MGNIKFSDVEKELFNRMVDYFIRSEEKEINELSLPSGNKDFLKDCKTRLKHFKDIKKKVNNLF